MAKKSIAHRITRLESVCIGAGFLLRKLQALYGGDFGHGLDEQVRQCIRECRQVEAAHAQREAAAAASESSDRSAA